MFNQGALDENLKKELHHALPAKADAENLFYIIERWVDNKIEQAFSEERKKNNPDW